jgi:hypothetical protein
MNLSQSHDSSHEFNMLNWVDPGHFFRSLSLFFFYFIIQYLFGGKLGFIIFSICFLWDYSELIQFFFYLLAYQTRVASLTDWPELIQFFFLIEYCFFLLISLSNNLILFIYFIFHYLGLMDFVFSILTFNIESVESGAF